MAVEEGLVKYIQNGLAALNSPPAAPPGGFFATLDKDTITPSVPQAWCYKGISSQPDDKTLTNETGWTEWRVQIDCHGYAAKDAINLARDIRKVLRGRYRGNLPDTDSTYVFGIFREPGAVDGYSDANRSFVRSLEYLIVYQQT